jgi:membrane protease YdiL (CAAX protease family)
VKTNKLFRFLVLVFVVGWLCQGLAIKYGVNGAGRSWLLASMWAPMLAALMTGRESRRRIWDGIKRSGWKIWPVALIVGWSFSIGQQLLLWSGHQGEWHSEFFHLSGDRGSIDSVHHVAMLLGGGHQGFGLFALNLLLSVTVGSLITTLIGGIGEEAGWRGLLQPELERRCGVFKGTIFVGLIWGYWHLPVNLAGYNDAKHPILEAAIIFQIATISMSFALAWLVRRTGSLWPAAMAHGANNVLQSGLLIVPNGWWADQLTTIVAALIVGMIFCWLLVRRNSRLVD